MSKSLGQHLAAARGAGRVGARDVVVVLRVAATTASRSSSPRTRCATPQGRLKRIREAGRRLVDGPSPAALREHRDAFFAALADDFNTAGALAALAAWVSEANKLRGRRARRPRRDVGHLRPGGARGAPTAATARRRGAGAARRARGRARRQGLGRGRPAARRAVRRRAGSSATAPTAPSWCPHEPRTEEGRRQARRRQAAQRRRRGARRQARQLRGDASARSRAPPGRAATRRPPAVAGRPSRAAAGRRSRRRARGPSGARCRAGRRRRRSPSPARSRTSSTAATRSSRRCAPGGARSRASGRRAGAAREPWLDGVQLEPADGDWLTQRAGSDAHQGLVADVGPYPYADPGELLTGSAAADRRARRGPGPAQPRRDRAHAPRPPARPGSSSRAIAPPRSPPPPRRRRAGAVEHLKIAQVRNLADYLAEAKAANLWVYGAAAKGTPYRQPDYTGGVVLVMGAEGTGLRPRVKAMCDDIVSLPMRGHVDSLNVSAAAAVLLYGVLDARAAAQVGRPGPNDGSNLRVRLGRRRKKSCTGLTALHNCGRVRPHNGRPEVEEPRGRPIRSTSDGARGGVRH